MYYDNINTLLYKLSVTKNVEENTVVGIELANEVLKIFGAPENELRYGDDVLNDAFPSRKFKHQKMETWFTKHPYLSSARIALIHFKSNRIPVESKFYKLSESSNKAKISATTQIDSNWEDGTLTMKPQYKVGIDFFLSTEGNSLLIVLTNRGNLRVLELTEKLSKTQIEIFSQVKGCFLFNGINPDTGLIDEFEPQRTIHRNLWNSFALQEVNRKFYLGVADHFEELVQHLQRNHPDGISNTNANNDAKLFATRLLGRLLFLWFLKKKDVISTTFKYFEVEIDSSTEYYESKLKKLFFSVLNTSIKERTFSDLETPYLNGGLFDPHPSDWVDKVVKFPSTWFASLYEHFNSFNFTTDESSPDYEQIAIDPEMLGRVFENLLATIVPETSSAASEKKNKGAFYTPREIVDYMSKESLKNYLKQSQNNKKDEDGIDKLVDMNDSDFLVLKSTGAIELWGNRTQEVRANLIQALNTMRVLDPACGSGAFPIGLLQLIVRTYDRLSAFYDKNLRIHRPIKPNEKNDVYETKLSIIQNNLFGSDIEPMAIEISRLRSWLSLVVDDKGKIDPLPNLDFNFVCANSLIPLDKTLQINMFENLDYEIEIEKLRDEYFQIHDKNSKRQLKTKFTTLYSTKLESDAETKRVKQLKTWNPFEADKPAQFFDTKTMFNVQGFDIVIGNPPYIHFEDIKTDSKNIYAPLKYKTYTPRGDIYALFYEMGMENLKEDGILCFITSNKWMRAGYGEVLRDYFVMQTQPTLLVDLGSGVFESAVVDTNILVLRKTRYVYDTKSITLTPKLRENDLGFYIADNSVPLKFEIGQTWIISNGDENSIKNKIENAGIELNSWPQIKINRGILTGLNEAFIITKEVRDRILQSCASKEEYNRTSEIIQPILRGRDIKKYSFEWSGTYLITLVPSRNYRIEEYPAIEKYLTNAEWTTELGFGLGKIKLEQTGKKHIIGNKTVKSRKLTSNKWFETQDQIAYIDDFYKTKIVYPNMTKYLPFVLDKEGFLTNQKCFILTGSYLEYLTAFLNSSLFKFCYINNFPELQGGTRELSKIFFEKIKVKIPSLEVYESCKKLVDEIQVKKKNSEKTEELEREIDKILFDFYELKNDEREKVGFIVI